MPRQIDHIVIISADLDAAIANATEAGFTVIPGGTHGDGRTHNALVSFADGAYIELIAPTSGTSIAGDHRWFPRLREGGGLVDYCLLGDDLHTEIRQIGERGISYPEPAPMERKRPDGEVLKWTLSTPPGKVGETGWPFLIEDVTPRELRVPGSASETRHANGATGIAGITILVEDLARARTDFAAILGTEGHEMVAPFSDDSLGTVFPIGARGGHWIMLVEPRASEALNHLEQHGQGPWRVTLRTHDGAIAPGEGDDLPWHLFSGARLRLA